MAYAHDLISNNTTHLIHHFTEYIILFSLVLIGIFTLKKIFYKNWRFFLNKIKYFSKKYLKVFNLEIFTVQFINCKWKFHFISIRIKNIFTSSV